MGFFLMSAITTQQIMFGDRTVQHFTILIAYMAQLQGPLQSLDASVQTFLDGVVSTERVFGVLKEKTKVANIADAREMTAMAADIEFHSVSPGSLEPLTFRCEPKTTTLLGISRSESSVLVYLLARIIEAQVGIIKIGGHDIRAYSMESLRRNIGFVPQDCKLLGNTVTQCLKYGLKDPENIDIDSVTAACQTVNIHNAILKLPGGYNAPLGQNGCPLSAEETRRLALARLVLQASQIFVLDGAITTLEEETETDLQEILRMVFDLRTVLVIE
jgi:ABC-type multidrug transport system fused ATPase/permease subunit